MTALERENLGVSVLTCHGLGSPKGHRVRQRLGFTLSLGCPWDGSHGSWRRMHGQIVSTNVVAEPVVSSAKRCLRG